MCDRDQSVTLNLVLRAREVRQKMGMSGRHEANSAICTLGERVPAIAEDGRVDRGEVGDGPA